MKIILLGAPGSGKGTLAKKISEDFKIPQISTGDLFRAIVKEESDFANRVKAIMSSGALVPDEITCTMLKNRIEKEDCKNGYILDGFPRTVGQAKEFEKISDVDAIILVELPFETIIERLSSRRTCSLCGEIFSTLNYKSDKCAKCGAKLVQRDDDKPLTIKNRLEVYETNTAPLINFYSDRIFRVSNDKDANETYKTVKTYLEKVEAKK